MSQILTQCAIETWLQDMRLYISQHAPNLLPLLDIYIGEAKFGRKLIHDDLSLLAPGATILEVGAGSMLLSCHLIKEGFDVTAIEPIGSGYSHFNHLQELILNLAKEQKCTPKILNIPVEQLNIKDRFDYSFSINVMEHVENVSMALSKIGMSLKRNAIYRFTCPNYLFPYEPHFNMPTLFSKSLTEKWFHNKIFNNKKIPDTVGTWNSLNWINVWQIKKKIRKLTRFHISFNRKYLIALFERICQDTEFSNRRSNWMIILIKGIVFLRVHYLIWFIPILMQPTIDCKITRLK